MLGTSIRCIRFKSGCCYSDIDFLIGCGVPYERVFNLMSISIPKWYAVHTRSRFEQVLCEALRRKGFEAFYPRMPVISRRKDRRLKIQVPILPGYVFVYSNLDPGERLQILQTKGVARIVTFNGNPVPADDREIQSLNRSSCQKTPNF